MMYIPWLVYDCFCIVSSRIRSTAAFLPPAALHNPLTSRALDLYPSASGQGPTTRDRAAANSPPSMSGATLLFPSTPIPRYSARFALS